MSRICPTVDCQLENLHSADECVSCGARLSADHEVGDPDEPDEKVIARQVGQAMLSHGKMPAIKLYKLQTGASLKEAKDFVEAAMAKHEIGQPKGPPPPAGSGCFGVVILVVTTATVVAVML